MSEIKFRITNLTCEACVKLSIMALKKIPHASNIEVDLTSGLGKVQSSQVIGFCEIEKALESVDKKAIVLN
ncbi:MAG: heavy metal-associated domain-containing protein [Candidatus Buchananbacteria bacterium]|nr:heavy metal-associated domain-containing protein [Candidatus Buchananbacteria bacterium]